MRTYRPAHVSLILCSTVSRLVALDPAARGCGLDTVCAQGWVAEMPAEGISNLAAETFREELRRSPSVHRRRLDRRVRWLRPLTSDHVSDDCIVDKPIM